MWRLVFIATLAIPRVARLAYPQLWIEDESYLNCAFLLAAGHRPYVDFPLPHLPALEAVLAAAFQVFPISIRTAEAFTQIAAFAGSVLVYAIGSLLTDRVEAGAAALIFATSPLVWRYHVFEREVFLVLPVLVATWLALRAPESQGRRDGHAIALGALLAVALSVKLTAVSYVGSFFLLFAMARRQRRMAVVLLATTATLIAVEVIALWAAFGSPFLVQVFVFRLVHAGFPSSVHQVSEFRNSLDLALAVGAVGIVVHAAAGGVRRLALPALALGCAFVLLVLLNPAFWPHDGIELLPWLALFGGGVMVNAGRALRRPGGLGKTARAARRRAFAALLAAVALLTFAIPLQHPDWPNGLANQLGFGYRERAEIARTAAYVRDRTAASDRVAMPPIIAFEANRLELVPYPELAGTMMEIEQQLENRGLVETVWHSTLRGRLFWDEVASSSERWLPALAGAIAEHRAAAVINFSEDDLFPVRLIDVPDQTLGRFGYEAGFSTEHYTVWIAPGLPR